MKSNSKSSIELSFDDSNGTKMLIVSKGRIKLSLNYQEVKVLTKSALIRQFKATKSVAGIESELTRLLLSLRLSVNLTQSEVAAHLGYESGQFISNWERGASRPPLDELNSIAKLFRTDVKALYSVYEADVLSEATRHIRREFDQSSSKFKALKNTR